MVLALNLSDKLTAIKRMNFPQSNHTGSGKPENEVEGKSKGSGYTNLAHVHPLDDQQEIRLSGTNPRASSIPKSNTQIVF